MDFSNKNLWLLFRVGEEEIYVTQTLLSTWIVMAVLIVFAVIVRIKVRSFKEIPTGFQNMLEALVEVMGNFTASMMGTAAPAFEGYFFGIFTFILVSNYSGLFGLRPPTADLSTTVALALFTFILIHVLGIVKQKKKYFKEYISPHPIFLPLNLIGEIAKPVSLSFRLFGNLLGGFIIMGLVYELFPMALQFVLPDILHAYFDIFAGALQAFIFTVLSMTFIQQRAFVEDDNI